MRERLGCEQGGLAPGAGAEVEPAFTRLHREGVTEGESSELRPLILHPDTAAGCADETLGVSAAGGERGGCEARG